jgi:hypothetical protein
MAEFSVPMGEGSTVYRSLSASLAATAICFATLGATVPAHAEGGLLGAIFNAIGRVIAPPRNTLPDMPPFQLPDAPGAEVRPTEGGPHVSFCVRTCDGRYFPVAKSGEGSPARTCQAMCPAAQTEIFAGNDIENAVSLRGTRYASLANAYVYRDKLVDGCTCNGKSPTGTANIDYLNDATLRPGDIVMTERGAVVFRGAPGLSHKLSDFVPVRESKRLSSATREQVGAMRVMPTRQASTRQVSSTRQARARAPQNRPEQRAATAAEAAAAVDRPPSIQAPHTQAPHPNVRMLGFAE